MNNLLIVFNISWQCASFCLQLVQWYWCVVTCCDSWPGPAGQIIQSTWWCLVRFMNDLTIYQTCLYIYLFHCCSWLCWNDLCTICNFTGTRVWWVWKSVTCFSPQDTLNCKWVWVIVVFWMSELWQCGTITELDYIKRSFHCWCMDDWYPNILGTYWVQ